MDTSELDVGTLVQRHRDAAGITQRELADRAGLTQGSLSAIERNRRSPTFATLVRLLDVLDLQLELGVTRRAAAIDASIEAAAARPLGDRLRHGSFDGVEILRRLVPASPVVEGPAGAVLHGAPVDVHHLDVVVARSELGALAAGLRALISDRWSDQYRMFGPADPDPRRPGAMRWLTIAGEVRVRVVERLPETSTVLVGDVLTLVLPVHEIESTDRSTARILARLRARMPTS